MNGLETLQRIRQGAPALPVILCSGMDDRPQSLCTDLALGFLAKPYTLDALVTLVSAAYARQPA
jgi:DNA-binding NtrC family response regulator